MRRQWNYLRGDCRSTVPLAPTLVGLQVVPTKRGPGFYGSAGPRNPAPVWCEAVMWVLMSAAERAESWPACRRTERGSGQDGPDARRPGLVQLSAGWPADRADWPRSRKARVIRAAGRFGPRVQDDSPPYCYISVEGPVVSEEELDPVERLAVARRYLGSAGGDRYVAGSPDPERENVAFPDVSGALAQPGSGQATCRKGSAARGRDTAG